MSKLTEFQTAMANPDVAGCLASLLSQETSAIDALVNIPDRGFDDAIAKFQLIGEIRGLRLVRQQFEATLVSLTEEAVASDQLLGSGAPIAPHDQ